MARVKPRCIMGCPGLKSSYREKVLLPDQNNNLIKKYLIYLSWYRLQYNIMREI